MKETDRNLKCLSCLLECESTLKSSVSWLCGFVLRTLGFFCPESSEKYTPKKNAVFFLSKASKKALVKCYIKPFYNQEGTKEQILKLTGS